VNFEELEALLGRARQGPFRGGRLSGAGSRDSDPELSDRVDRREGDYDQPAARPAGEAEHGEDAQSSGAGRARIPSAQR